MYNTQSTGQPGPGGHGFACLSFRTFIIYHTLNIRSVPGKVSDTGAKAEASVGRHFGLLKLVFVWRGWTK